MTEVLILQLPLDAVKRAREKLDMAEAAVREDDQMLAAVLFREISEELGYASVYQHMSARAKMQVEEEGSA